MAGGAGWRRWLVLLPVAVVAILAHATNYVLAADRMFRQPTLLSMRPADASKVPRDRLVVGIAVKREARAYPLMFIGYHHQVRDSEGGREVLVSYCTVCRTGRVFSPPVDGRAERFRLVGMDHGNAMFEDEHTGSWWRQATAFDWRRLERERVIDAVVGRTPIVLALAANSPAGVALREP